MRWKVKTETEEFIISATSSKDAVAQIIKKGKGPVVSASLMPKNTVDKAKSKWRNWFGK